MARKPFAWIFEQYPKAWQLAEKHCTERQFQFLHLYYQAEMTQKQIAKAMGVGQASVYKTIFGNTLYPSKERYGGGMKKFLTSLAISLGSSREALQQEEDDRYQAWLKDAPRRHCEKSVAFYKTPEGKAYLKEWAQRPGVKARIQENRKVDYQSHKEARLAYMKEYHKRPEVQAKTRERAQSPERKQWEKAYCQRPEVKARNRNLQRQRRARLKQSKGCKHER